MDDVTKTRIFDLDQFLEGVREHLSKLGVRHRIAFAAYCAEGLFSFYSAYVEVAGVGDDAGLRVIIDELWSSATGRPMSRKGAATRQVRLEMLDVIEHDHDEWDAAVDALSAVWLGLECWKGKSADNAAKAAEKVVNRVEQRLTDEFVGRNKALTSAQTRRLIARIDRHPSVQRIRRELLDVIDFLERRPQLNQLAVEELRLRAARQRAML